MAVEITRWSYLIGQGRERIRKYEEMVSYFFSPSTLFFCDSSLRVLTLYACAPFDASLLIQSFSYSPSDLANPAVNLSFPRFGPSISWGPSICSSPYDVYYKIIHCPRCGAFSGKTFMITLLILRFTYLIFKCVHKDRVYVRTFIEVNVSVSYHVIHRIYIKKWLI